MRLHHNDLFLGEADGKRHGTQWSDARTDSITSSPMLIPTLGKEAEAPMFRPLPEQLFMAMANIARLKDGEAYVLTVDMSAPARICTPDVHRSDISALCVDACTGWYQGESGLALPLAVAHQQILDRDAQFASGPPTAEVVSPRRRLHMPERNVHDQRD